MRLFLFFRSNTSKIIFDRFITFKKDKNVIRFRRKSRKSSKKIRIFQKIEKEKKNIFVSQKNKKQSSKKINKNYKE